MILLLKSIYKLITSLTDLIFSLIPISLCVLALVFYSKVNFETHVVTLLLLAVLIELILIEQKLNKNEKEKNNE